MKSTDLYAQLEKDFIFPELHDEFAIFMPDLHPYMTDSFKERSMGLVCDFTDEVKSVYTAVFPSDKVMTQIFAGEPRDAMLFLHHPSVWDYRGSEQQRWFQMDNKWAELCKECKVSIYAIHVPLDNFGLYSTSRTLADALGIEIIEPFAEYRGGLAGVIGKTACKTVSELSDVFTRTVGHRTSLYPYGNAEIIGGRVAVVAGGGNDMEILPAVTGKAVSTLITGITVENEISAAVHQYEKENRINLLGGTHYSTEKFACQKICAYFQKLGLPARFIEDLPVLEDL
jgi:putative NIF3 family GTP cyclohydrolase 1 type 2